MNILVAGLGKLGSVMAALLADAGHTVQGVDPNAKVRSAIDNRQAPVDEPGLGDLIAGLPANALATHAFYDEAVDLTDAAMIVVPTPSLPGGAFDPHFVVEAVKSIGRQLKRSGRRDPYLIVVCSTLTPGTMDTVVAPALEDASGLTVGESALLAYSPEFIALGTVINDMRNPDTILVGTRDLQSMARVMRVWENVRDAPALNMSFVEAEIAKLAINAYLSVKIGFANMIGAAVETMGGNPATVLSAIGQDSRIGTAYLRKGGPPTGPCLPRDLVALEAFGDHAHVPMHLATAARDVAKYVVKAIVEDAGLHQKVPRPKVAVLGVAYKPGSSVTDESLARQIIQQAMMTGAHVATYDPHAELPPSFPFQHRRCDTLEEALAVSEIVIIGCPHEEFRGIDVGRRRVINPWA
jgi:UDPglucose 6-dehydrogenase